MPDGASDSAAPIAAGVTLLVVVGMVLRAPPSVRLWSPIIGIAAGCAVGVPFGLYDVGAVADAAWFGVPFGDWPGFDLTPGREFWALLPAFIVVTLVGAIETIGDGVAIQRVSRRRPQATDFRVVQGALNADGVGNLLSGLAGTLPNTTYSTSISLAEVTGIGARRVGVIIGVIIFALAFFPKFAALLIAIPAPVAAAYILVLIALLFVQGMKIVVHDGLDHRKASVAGMAFWIGVGFQNGWIFPDLLGGRLPGHSTGERHDLGRDCRRCDDGVPGADRSPAPEAAGQHGPRNAAQTGRLLARVRGEGWMERGIGGAAGAGGGGDACTACRPTRDAPDGANGRRLVVTARSMGRGAELEFISATEGENLEDRLAYLGEGPEITDDREISYRLLRHLSSSVSHHKYHGVDVVSVSVANATPRGDGEG